MDRGANTRRRVRPRRWVATAVALVVTAAACGSSPESSGSTNPVFVPRTTTTVPPPPPSTTTTTVPVDLLGSCVQYAKFQAFTGNEFWADMWEGAGETDAGMRATCDFLASGAEPGWLEQIHQEWEALQLLTAPTTAATSSTTTTPP